MTPPSAIDPEVMIRQTLALPSDLRRLVPALAERISEISRRDRWSEIVEVTAVGSGDSHFAALSSSLAFQQFGGLPLRSMPPLSHLYERAGCVSQTDGRLMLLATSTSGRTPGVLRALKEAVERGALTVAITSAPDTPATSIAKASIVAELPDMERSPGIRTYQASLVCHLLIAVGLGQARGLVNPAEGEALRSALAETAVDVEAVLSAMLDQCARIAPAFAAASVATILGSGPNLGSARYAAAKLVEGTALFAVGQDIEEWWHIERFADPVDSPLVLLAAPGHSHARAVEVAEAGHTLGRFVVTIGPDGDPASRHAQAHLAMAATDREEFSPLFYSLFAPVLAARIALLLGRSPFQGDRPKLHARLTGYRQRTGRLQF